MELPKKDFMVKTVLERKELYYQANNGKKYYFIELQEGTEESSWQVQSKFGINHTEFGEVHKPYSSLEDAKLAFAKIVENKKRKGYVETIDNLIGKRVQVNVGNDTWGEVIVPGISYLVTCEVNGEYGISPIYEEITDEVLVEKHIHKFTVQKKDVELWKSPMERFLNPERIERPDIDIDLN